MISLQISSTHTDPSANITVSDYAHAREEVRLAMSGVSEWFEQYLQSEHDTILVNVVLYFYLTISELYAVLCVVSSWCKTT
jgi:hypothetical protein